MTHRLEVVYLHAKYEKPILNDKKVTARTRFVKDAGTDLTLKSKFKVKGHQQWYATHRLRVHLYGHSLGPYSDQYVRPFVRPCVRNKSCRGCNFFVVQDRLCIFGM
jgi:hypothetical protein